MHRRPAEVASSQLFFRPMMARFDAKAVRIWEFPRPGSVAASGFQAVNEIAILHNSLGSPVTPAAFASNLACSQKRTLRHVGLLG
jgi:hypothetical protein